MNLNMLHVIGFGELNKHAREWQQDISNVELAYATDWLLKGIFEDLRLGPVVCLRGASTLRYAYFEEYPLLETPEFLLAPAFDREALGPALVQAAHSAAAASGLKYAFLDVERGTARFEYTGPLGRRSAAQPHLNVLFLSGDLRVSPTQLPLLHRFSDKCEAAVRAVALEEFVAGHIVQLVRAAPRARDLFDLWFALTHGKSPLDGKKTRELVQSISKEKGIDHIPPSLSLAPETRATLGHTWDRALRNAPNRPSFATVERDIVAAWNT